MKEIEIESVSFVPDYDGFTKELNKLCEKYSLSIDTGDDYCLTLIQSANDNPDYICRKNRYDAVYLSPKSERIEEAALKARLAQYNLSQLMGK